MMTSSTGAVVWQVEAKPFGDGASITGSTLLNLRFPGQYYDSETGLHQNWFRDYMPKVGRYAEPDPIGQWKDVVLYRYVRNNPIKRIDRAGLFELDPDADPFNTDDPIVTGPSAVQPFVTLGGQAAAYAGLGGFSISGGGIATCGQQCVQVQVCMRIGPGWYAGAGPFTGGGLAYGNLSGPGGGIGLGVDAGAGAAVGGSVQVGSSTVGAIKGRGGVGGGVSVGVDLCLSKTWCL